MCVNQCVCVFYLCIYIHTFCFVFQQRVLYLIQQERGSWRADECSKAIVSSTTPPIRSRRTRTGPRNNILHYFAGICSGGEAFSINSFINVLAFISSCVINICYSLMLFSIDIFHFFSGWYICWYLWAFIVDIFVVGISGWYICEEISALPRVSALVLPSAPIHRLWKWQTAGKQNLLLPHSNYLAILNFLTKVRIYYI